MQSVGLERAFRRVPNEPEPPSVECDRCDNMFDIAVGGRQGV